jgi:hypothetical protein
MRERLYGRVFGEIIAIDRLSTALGQCEFDNIWGEFECLVSTFRVRFRDSECARR